MKKNFLNKLAILGIISSSFVFTANAQFMQNNNHNNNNNTRPPTTHLPTSTPSTWNQPVGNHNNNNHNNTWHPPVNYPQQNSGTLRAFPTSGRSPLSVVFTNTYSRRSGTLTLDYGDGTNESMNSVRNVHVYRRPGTYTARVVQGFCPRGAQCFAPERVLDTVTIRVNGNYRR